MQQKLPLCLLAAIASLWVHSQSLVLPVTEHGSGFTAQVGWPPVLADLSSTTNFIVGELSSKLALKKEKVLLANAIGSFLQQKNSIMQTTHNNPAGYKERFLPLQKDLFGKLSGIMGAAKFGRFIELKPQTPTGALAILFY